jgi:hypothetical protein
MRFRSLWNLGKRTIKNEKLKLENERRLSPFRYELSQIKGERKSKHNSKNSRTPMEIIYLIFGSSISGVIGLFFARASSRSAKRIEFTDFIVELTYDLERAGNKIQFHRESVERVGRACFKVSPYLKEARHKDIQVLWNYYKSLSFDPKNERESYRELEEIFGKTPPPTAEASISLCLRKLREAGESWDNFFG